jgi:hypothetical protein
MVRRIVLFLIRRKLGLKHCQGFQFTNQKSKEDWYYIDQYHIWKVAPIAVGISNVAPSSVSLNWLLDDRCEIIKKEG